VGVAPDPEDTVEWLPAATEEPRAVERLTREESLKARRQLRISQPTYEFGDKFYYGRDGDDVLPIWIPF